MFRKVAILGALGGALALQSPSGQLDQLSANDKDFVEFAGETDLLAVRLGHLAGVHGATEEVRNFGRKMADEHAQDLKSLTTVANKTGGVAPDTLDDQHSTTLKRVSKLKGKDFDHQFLKTVVNQHENALVSFKREADHGFNQDLQAYAKKTLPTMERHLKQAKELDSAGK